MARSALVDPATGVVTNIILADPTSDAAPEGVLMVDVSEVPCGIGWTYAPAENRFIAPPEPEPPEPDASEPEPDAPV